VKWEKQKMRDQCAQLVILPDVPKLSLLYEFLKFGFREANRAGAPMFVEHFAMCRQQHLPAAAPGTVTQIGVFHITG
jgi:hypothetical protein